MIYGHTEQYKASMEWRSQGRTVIRDIGRKMIQQVGISMYKSDGNVVREVDTPCTGASYKALSD